MTTKHPYDEDCQCSWCTAAREILGSGALFRHYFALPTDTARLGLVQQVADAVEAALAERRAERNRRRHPINLRAVRAAAQRRRPATPPSRPKEGVVLAGPHDPRWAAVDPALGLTGRAWLSFLGDLVADCALLASVTVSAAELPIDRSGEIDLMATGDGGFWAEIRIAPNLTPAETEAALAHEVAHLVQAARWGPRWGDIAEDRTTAERFASSREVWPYSLAAAAMESAPAPPGDPPPGEGNE